LAGHADTRPASRRGAQSEAIEVIAISAGPREGSEQLQADWKLERLPVAYGLTEPSMRAWGLFVSRGRKDDERFR
jgi:hypothetical protein